MYYFAHNEGMLRAYVKMLRAKKDAYPVLWWLLKGNPKITTNQM